MQMLNSRKFKIFYTHNISLQIIKISDANIDMKIVTIFEDTVIY